MNQHLQNILKLIQRSAELTDADKASLENAVHEAEKAFEIINFKLDRTEKVKRTTAILLEETIQELEQKRKAVEAQNRELEIEAALEKVRSRSLAMRNSNELQDVVQSVFERLLELNIELDTAIIIIFEEGSKDSWWWLSNRKGQQYPRVLVKYVDDLHLRRVIESREKGIEFFSESYGSEEKNALLNHLFEHTDFRETPEEQKKYLLGFAYATMSVALTKNIAVQVTRYAENGFSEKENEIFKRFTHVFDQAYTRFLDLQKAEAQAREAQIEAALEKVRAKVMAMNSSQDLDSTSLVFGEQLRKLGIDWQFSYFWLIEENKDENTFWITWPDYQTSTTSYSLAEADESFLECIIAWREQVKIHSSHVLVQDVQPWLDTFERITQDAGGAAMQIMRADNFKDGVYYYDAMIKFGSFGILMNRATQEEEKTIQHRFAIEFERAYTRFLDLQKAEAQAREAQIEAALERVRAKGMAMHHTSELQEVVNTVAQQLQKMDIDINGGVFITINEEIGNDLYFWGAAGTATYSQKTAVPFLDRPIFTRLRDAIKKREGFLKEAYTKEEKIEFFKHIFKYAPYNETPAERMQEVLSREGGYSRSAAISHNTSIFIINHNGKEFSDADDDILKRFGKVFEQTYTRFLDLQKAEAQTREAQIEASLERIRAKAMAMHHSEDLNEAVAVVFEELDKLNLDMLRCGIGIINKEKRSADAWITSKSDGKATVQISGNESMDIHPLLQKAFDAVLRQEDLTYVLEGEDLLSYYRTSGLGNVRLPDSQLILTENTSKKQYYHIATFQAGGLFAFRETPYPDEAIKILKRFVRVFDLTYKRFLDLQNAEAQAREAQIEAALERVRGKAMAMQNSNDLSVTASAVFVELKKLGIHSIRSGVGLLTPESRKVILYSATSSEEGDHLSLVGWAMLQDHPVLSEIYDSWIRHEDYFPILEGELLQTYYQKIQSSFSVPSSHYKQNLPGNALINSNSDNKQYGHFLAFSEGSLYVWSEIPYTESEIKILNRFKLIIDLTFRRYIELQKSEANAREAVRQASLDRVRAQTASMRTTSDLERITPLMWNELTTLGVPFIRCGVFIMDDEIQIVHTYLSTPEGKDIAAIHLPYVGIPLTEQAVAHWRNQSIYTEHWDKEDFQNWTRQLIDLGHIKSAESYQAGSAPGQLHLHFIPFAQGMLYVGSIDPLPEESLDLIKSLADAFATAYARYEDFNKLEKAKHSIESTLTELKATQAQLIQAEKMASLGELTAGIAHEIQNPLNFVNNFSELNKELLEELREEIAQQRFEEVKKIVKDVIENEEKITAHGKRADAIVKSMLQHSRSSGGQKELTDINALADEYLRLAYHGFRAKDKSFSANFKTQFDPSLGKILLIPQDIGRVLLNLINNAFYAVTERKKLFSNGYDPLVTVSTKKLNAKVDIRVRDNGTGIPDKVLDKIFQPFFSTKPTGQGTGLGLSLSYDIIKAHGGELRIDTKEGQGSEFIILLPIITE